MPHTLSTTATTKTETRVLFVVVFHVSPACSGEPIDMIEAYG
jgi:hypothetical protein